MSKLYKFSTLANATIIVYHARDIKPNNLPNSIKDGQYNLFLNHESPYHTGDAYKQVPKDFFNLTATYRSDSNLVQRFSFIPIDRHTSSDEIWSWSKVKFIFIFFRILKP
jgi:hypothetical protein